jgi:hypothetical protein
MYRWAPRHRARDRRNQLGLIDREEEILDGFDPKSFAVDSSNAD